MSTVLFHLSDFHFKRDQQEGHGVVLDQLLDDIAEQLKALSHCERAYIVFSGDVVQSGTDEEAYEDLFVRLKERLDRLGLTKDRIAGC